MYVSLNVPLPTTYVAVLNIKIVELDAVCMRWKRWMLWQENVDG